MELAWRAAHVIPVGQTWPWLPAHRKLPSPADGRTRRAEPCAATVGSWKLRTTYVLRAEGPAIGEGLHHGPRNGVVARITRGYTGYNLDIAGDPFDVRRVRSLKGRAVLERREQALAAMQYRGRQMDTWTELVYDDRSYRLHYKDDGSGETTELRDGVDRPVLEAQDGRITLLAALPLPLIAMVATRIIDESAIERAVHNRR